MSPNMRLAGGEWTSCKGGKTNAVPQLPARVKNEGELDLHTKPRRVAVTDLSEESTFGAGRNASAVWPRPVTVKRLSSFRPGGQERPELVEAAGLLGCFRLTRLRGCWREEDRPWAPQTVVGEGRMAWAPPLGGSFLGSDCSLDTEEGVEQSLALLGMNCLRAADCVLAERNLSTTALTASPNNPDSEMGASIKNTFSFSRISVRLSHRWRSAATEAAIERPMARAVCLVALRAKSVALRSSFTASGVKPVPSSISFRNVRLVGLKDGHCVKGHTCLTGRDVGLSDKGGSGPTRLGRKEGAGLPRRSQRG